LFAVLSIDQIEGDPIEDPMIDLIEDLMELQEDLDPGHSIQILVSKCTFLLYKSIYHTFFWYLGVIEGAESESELTLGPRASGPALKSTGAKGHRC
jgi:hypothetical protein